MPGAIVGWDQDAQRPPAHHSPASAGLLPSDLRFSVEWLTLLGPDRKGATMKSKLLHAAAGQQTIALNFETGDQVMATLTDFAAKKGRVAAALAPRARPRDRIGANSALTRARRNVCCRPWFAAPQILGCLNVSSRAVGCPPGP